MITILIHDEQHALDFSTFEDALSMDMRRESSFDDFVSREFLEKRENKDRQNEMMLMRSLT
jgi:hypothetical protein